MLDFVLFGATAVICLILGFLVGYYYSIYKLKYEDIDYNITIIKEDIISLNVRFQNIEDLLREKAEDKSL